MRRRGERVRSPVLRLAALSLTVVAAVAACSSDRGPAATSSSTTTTSASPSTSRVGGRLRVTVDPGQVFQTIDGFGATVRLFDDPHVTETFDPATARARVVVPVGEQDAILRALYVDLGLTRTRMATADGIQPVRGGPSDFSWKLHDGYLDFADRAVPLGLVDTWLSPIKLEPWATEDDPAAYVDWAFAQIQRWSERGRPLTYFSLMNEPANQKGPRSGAFHREAIKLLGARLRSAGLPTGIVLPDDLNATEAAHRIREVMADPEAARYVAAFAYHLYPQNYGEDEVRDLGSQYGKPVWMTEFFLPDAIEWGVQMHHLLVDGGVSAIDYLWGFFGQWEEDRGSELIVLRHEADGTYRSFDRTLQYYVFGQYSRFVRPGAQRIGASVSGADDVLASAFRHGPQVTVVLVNPGPEAVSGEVDLPASGPARAVRTSAEERWVETVPRRAAVAGDVATYAVDLPPGSVTTVVAG